MNGARTQPRWIGITFLVLCAVVLAYAWVSAAGTRYSDELDYWEIAGNLATGQGFIQRGAPTAFRPPTWPMALVPAQLFGLGMIGGSLTSVAALVGAAVLAGKLGRTVTGQASGAVAGLFVLAYPINIYTAATLYPQMLALLLTVLMWGMLAQSEVDGTASASRMAAFGVSAGLLSLAVPTLAFTALALLAAATWLTWRARKWGAAAIGWGTAGAVVAVWVARNWITFGEFIPISTSTGVNLLLGNNPNATPDSGVNADISETLEKVYALGLSENGSSQVLVKEALQWVTDHPSDATMLYLQKVLHYFVAYDTPATANQGSHLLSVVAWVVWLAVLGLVAVRWSKWGSSRLRILFAEWVMLWIFLANSLVMAVFFTRVRFRTPLDSFVLVEAAIGSLLLVRHTLRRRGARAATS